jgi:hypothetical protein
LGTSVSYVIVLAITITFALRTIGAVNWTRVLLSTGLASAGAGFAMLAMRDSFFPAVVAGTVTYLTAYVVVERAVFGTRLGSVVDLVRGSAGR